MERVRRSAVATLLLLLAVTFGPLLCRVGGVEAVPTARAAVPQAAVAQAETAQTEAAETQEAHAADRTATHYAMAQAPKKCSGQHAPSQNESAPVPTPNRGEPLTPAATGPAPLTAHAPACFALARPPTGTAPATDHTALLPVLRM
ncbi:hypothetical protein ADK86_18445 [Streptomyces sp. NRRL F-5755]|uniref:hypothetical protein n=1 Tax=Streptomyces sp. NRRL F-5755 TaxID=1519475 RepID=UPI0006AE229C|nr:hypothetical protein [Streptomyces sp. NRRL F-5755]KOT93804.1 hypothetical protein ADK86_18445 [Streptomyces sp. NRRL F-5755]